MSTLKLTRNVLGFKCQKNRLKNFGAPIKKAHNIQQLVEFSWG